MCVAMVGSTDFDDKAIFNQDLEGLEPSGLCAVMQKRTIQSVMCSELKSQLHVPISQLNYGVFTFGN